MTLIAPPKSETTGHSADVQLLLHVGQQTYALADVGPRDATLKMLQEIPGGEAVIEIITDGRPHRRRVTIEPPAETTRRICFL